MSDVNLKLKVLMMLHRIHSDASCGDVERTKI